MKARVISQAHDIAPTVGKAGSPSPRTCAVHAAAGPEPAPACHCQAARQPGPTPQLTPLQEGGQCHSVRGTETLVGLERNQPPPQSYLDRSMEMPTTLVIREEPAAPAAAGGPAGGGLVAALRELLELKDRRIQASAFFFAWGGSVVLHGTVLNRADNPEHVLAGYGLFAIGAALGFLTLSGSDRLGHAAARAEEVLKGFFQ